MKSIGRQHFHIGPVHEACVWPARQWMWWTGWSRLGGRRAAQALLAEGIEEKERQKRQRQSWEDERHLDVAIN